VIWFLTAINSLGVKQGAQVQLLTTILKFVPLVLIAIVGLFFVDTNNLTPFAPHGTWKAISAAAPLTLWAFIGLESATVAAEEVKDPEKNFPKATIYGTLAATIVYVLATFVVMGAVPTHTLAYSAAAQTWMYFTEPELFERKLFIRDMAIAALAFVYSVWAITGSGKDIIAKGFVLLLAGVPVYVLMKGWQRREALKAAFAREPCCCTVPTSSFAA
jgi:amino acid transporter